MLLQTAGFYTRRFHLGSSQEVVFINLAAHSDSAINCKMSWHSFITNPGYREGKSFAVRNSSSQMETYFIGGTHQVDVELELDSRMITFGYHTSPHIMSNELGIGPY
jgi:hypothetical protein